MFRFTLLGSGSSGNAALFVSSRAKILIDNGLSFKELQRRAALVGADLNGLDGVLVTHEHVDHVGGVGILARKTGVPVYLTPGTHRALPQGVGSIPEIRLFESGDTLQFGDLSVGSFAIPHDAADPVSYTVSCAGAKLGLATDLGKVNHLVRARLADSHALVLESNYCPDQLAVSSYPAQVQQRIRSPHGHLSNRDMASLLSSLLHERLRTVVLVHISENNNTPEAARRLAESALRGHGATLHVAAQHDPTPFFEVLP